jgi:hypothetical protein
MKTFLFFLLLSIAWNPAWSAADDDVGRDSHQAALQQVRQAVKDQQARKQMLDTAEARKVSGQVKDLTGGGANEQELYELAGDILGNFEGKSPEEMQKALDTATKNPEKFAMTLTPQQLERLKNISERLPAAKTQKP